MQDWEKFYKPIPVEDIPPLSEHAKQHGLNPQNMGEIEDANGYGKVAGVCGDTMEMWIKVRDDKHEIVDETGFRTDGCYSSRACGSALTCIAKGLTMDAILKLSPADVIEELDGIPEKHCSILAISALFRAVGDYMLKSGKW